MNDAAPVRTRGTAAGCMLGAVLLAWCVAVLGSLLAPSEAQAYAATASYSCPSGGTLSGSTCTQTQAATWNGGYYYCPSGGSLSGTTCTQSQAAFYSSGYYYCPSGGSLSGSTCYTSSSYGASTSTTYGAFGSWSADLNGCGTTSFSGRSDTATIDYDNQQIWPSSTAGTDCAGDGTMRWRSRSISSSYYCPSGGSLSGSTCTVSSSYAASYQSGYYYCSGGWSLSGSTCYYSYAASYQSSWYSCPGGYSLSGSTCTRTYTASMFYSCPSGGGLSGSQCLPTNVAVSDGAGADVAYDNSPPLDANWTAATGGTISTYEWCFTTSTCASGAVVSGSSAARVASSGVTVLSSGITYLACVRAMDSTGDYGAWACSNGARFDAVAPPNVTTLATAAATLTPPALTWTTVSDPGSGTAYYRVYRGTSSTGPWTQISTDGATVSGAYTDPGAPWGPSWYMVQAVDAAGNEAAASNVVSTDYHRMPTITLVGPATGSANAPVTPTLTARHDDLDGDVGSVQFELCSNSTCSAIDSSTTNTAVAAASNTSWTISPALAQGTQYWWRVRTTDSSGAVSAWSAIWTFTTTNTPLMNVTSTLPANVPQGLRGATVQVNGAEFASGATVDMGPGVTVIATTWVSASRVDVTVDVSAAATIGARTVTVTNPDASSADGTGIFAVRAPSISMGMTALGYDDSTRTTSGAQTTGFGQIDIGSSRAIGPAGSGQATPGAAIELTLTSDTDAVVQATATNLDGAAGASIPAGQLAWRTAGTSNAWAPFSTTATTVEAAMTPGTTTFAYDLQLSIPADQRAGTYAGSVAWTVIPRP